MFFLSIHNFLCQLIWGGVMPDWLNAIHQWLAQWLPWLANGAG